MKAALRILAYLSAVLFLGCLLAPPLYLAGQALGNSAGLQFLVAPTFQRYYHRAILIAAVALLWPLYRSLDIKGWDPLGLLPNPRRIIDLAGGFFAAAGLLFLMGLLAWKFEVYRAQDVVRWDKIFKGLLAAAVVPPLEEWFFRCALLGVVLRTAARPVALLFVSALFSSIHFLKPQDVEITSIHWWSGFALLPYSFHRFAEPFELIGGFTTLFAIGMVLALATLRTRSLWAAIGLHAGWIFGNRLFNIIFKRQGTFEPWFGDKIEVGIAPLCTVILTGFLVLSWLNRTHPRRDATHSSLE